MRARWILLPLVLAAVWGATGWINRHAEASGRNRRLVAAVKSGGVVEVRGLLAARADPRTRDENGTPALELALAFGHPELLPILLPGGADPNAQDAKGMRAI